MAADENAKRLPGIEYDRMQQAAEALLQARREVFPITDLTIGLRPHTLEEAYALQDIMAADLGPIGGWKVGAPSPEATPLFGPMPLLGGFARSGQVLSEKYRRLRGVEAEIAFQLKHDLPPRIAPYSREEAVDAIGSAHPAIELLESAYYDPDKADRLSMIGDLQMNGGFVFGPPFAGWQAADLAKESVIVTISGAVRFEGTATNTAGTDLLRLVVYLANEGQQRTGGLRAGDWITTGSWSGKAFASKGSEVEVRFSTFGTTQIYFE